MENEAQSSLLGSYLCGTMKVDNHTHLAAATSTKQCALLVKEKLKMEFDAIVEEDGETLSEVFRGAGMTADNLTIDAFSGSYSMSKI